MSAGTGCRLEIRDLHASVAGGEILKGIDLSVSAGEVHALMGPNGSGKSTLSNVIAGREGYEVTQGEILYNGEDLLALPAEVRARSGVFMAFQYPIEIPGISNGYFMRTTLNAVRAHRGEDEIDAFDFLTLVKDKMKLLDMDHSFLDRSVNEGFSGGEKKRNEILQMMLLEPALGVLDETDSGLDIDALRIVADGVNRMRTPDRAFLVITHYQRLLEYIVPDVTHVIVEGQIVRSGDHTLALELEKRGYNWIRDEEQASRELA